MYQIFDYLQYVFFYDIKRRSLNHSPKINMKSMPFKISEIFIPNARSNIIVLLTEKRPGLYSNLSARRTGFTLDGKDVGDVEILLALMIVFKEEGTQEAAEEWLKRVTGNTTPPS